MKAVVQRGYGGSDVLSVGEVAAPTPGPHEVLVRVEAAAVHAGDIWIMRGEPRMIRWVFGRRTPRNPVVGRDVAGTVVAVGAKATAFDVGDRVFAEADRGGLAEFTVVNEKFAASVPEAIDTLRAAALPVSATTALQGMRLAMLDRPRAGVGRRVLVIGASGGVGTYAVQLAAASGAEVTAVCSGAKADHARAAGAAHVLDYARDDVTSATTRYDVIFDLSGRIPLGRLRRVLTERGTLVLSSGTGSATFGPLPAILRALALSPFTRQRLKPLAAVRSGADLAEIARLVADGVLRPPIDRVFAFDDAVQAFDALASGSVRGKVVVRVAETSARPDAPNSRSAARNAVDGTPA